MLSEYVVDDMDVVPASRRVRVNSQVCFCTCVYVSLHYTFTVVNFYSIMMFNLWKSIQQQHMKTDKK